MMGDFRTNNRNIEVQLIRRFTIHSHLLSMTVSNELDVNSSLMPILNELSNDIEEGSVGSTSNKEYSHLQTMSSRLCDLRGNDWSDVNDYRFAKYKVFGLSKCDEDNLRKMYESLYDQPSIDVLPSCKEVKTLHLGTTTFGSQRSKSSNITAYWSNDNGDISWDVTPRPGTIIRFLSHSVLISGEMKTHLLAEVKWHHKLSQTDRHYVGPPVEAWHPSVFVPRGPSSFMPIQRVKSKFVKCEGHISSRRVMFVCPRDQFVIV